MPAPPAACPVGRPQVPRRSAARRRSDRPPCRPDPNIQQRVADIMEKKSLAKHHFWILLALAMVLIPVVIGGAAFGVGGTAKEEKKKIDTEIDKLNKASPKTLSYIEKLGEQ